MENRKKYEKPRVEELGSAADKTQTGIGDTNDGNAEPPQAQFGGTS